jgi:mannose-1-phosphate guanylyltransferase
MFPVFRQVVTEDNNIVQEYLKKISNKGRIVSLMNFWNDSGAWVSLKGISRDSNKPESVRNDVFHSSPSAILIIL